MSCCVRSTRRVVGGVMTSQQVGTSTCITMVSSNAQFGAFSTTLAEINPSALTSARTDYSVWAAAFLPQEQCHAYSRHLAGSRHRDSASGYLARRADAIAG